MSWPLLFGENHLAATHSLSNHREKTVTFCHPAMNFTISCDKAPVSQDPHVAVTCVLTGKPNGHAAPTKTIVYRGLNLFNSLSHLKCGIHRVAGKLLMANCS